MSFEFGEIVAAATRLCVTSCVEIVSNFYAQLRARALPEKCCAVFGKEARPIKKLELFPILFDREKL